MWEVVACVVAGAYAAQQQAKESRGRVEVSRPAERSLEQAAREHRQRMDAMNRETLSGARQGMLILGVIVLAAGYFIGKLFGL